MAYGLIAAIRWRVSALQSSTSSVTASPCHLLLKEKAYLRTLAVLLCKLNELGIPVLTEAEFLEMLQ